MPRPRKPDAVRLLHGQKVDPPRVSVDDSPPEPPDSLSDQARDLWGYYLPLLEGTATTLDRDTLANFCEVQARLRLLQARLASGQVPMDQEWRLDAQVRSYVTSARQLAQQLGLTPRSRESGWRVPPGTKSPPTLDSRNPARDMDPERLLT